MPDYGRAACYRAENRAFPRRRELVLSQAEILAAVAEVHAAAGDGKTLPRVQFGDLRGAWALSYQRIVKFNAAGASLFTVLHELAHVYVPHEGHGPGWRRKYVALVDQMVGRLEACALAEAFRAEGVSLTAVAGERPPRKFRGRQTYRVEIRKVTASRSEVSGNVTRWFHQYAEWEAAPEGFKISDADRRDMRRGCIMHRYHSTGGHSMLVRMVRVWKEKR